jgi:hypothetical protein
VIVLRWRRALADDPVEQLGIGAIKESFEPIELGRVETRNAQLGESAENEIALLRPAMPRPE